MRFTAAAGRERRGPGRDAQSHLLRAYGDTANGVRPGVGGHHDRKRPGAGHRHPGPQKGALAAKGRAIAVLGCWIDAAYPRENKSLMEAIVRSGAVITENSSGQNRRASTSRRATVSSADSRPRLSSSRPPRTADRSSRRTTRSNRRESSLRCRETSARRPAAARTASSNRAPGLSKGQKTSCWTWISI